MELTKLVLNTTRYSGEHAFFLKKIQNLKKVVKIVAFQGNSGNSGGDGVLNSNQRGTGRGKTVGDLGEWVPRVPRGIPNHGYNRSILCIFSKTYKFPCINNL